MTEKEFLKTVNAQAYDYDDRGIYTCKLLDKEDFLKINGKIICDNV